MHVLFLVIDPLIAFIDGANFIVGAASGKKLADAIKDFIAPLLLLAMGLAAATFLFQQQITRFLQFMALAVGVALFFYFPGVTENVAALIEKALK